MTREQATKSGFRFVKDTDNRIMVRKDGSVITFEKGGKAVNESRWLKKRFASVDRYPRVTYILHGKTVHKLIHRLVAEAFIPNPLGLPEVNHIDEDPLNCSAENLEWCDRMYNANYGTAIKRGSETRKKYVSQYDARNELVGVYKGVVLAQRLTGTHHISNICKGDDKRKTANGFDWRFEKAHFPCGVETITVTDDGNFVCEVEKGYAESTGIIGQI